MDPAERIHQVVDGYRRGLTLQRIADEVGVSRERVRQILAAKRLGMEGRRERRYQSAIAGRSAELIRRFLNLFDIEAVAQETGIDAALVSRFIDESVPDAKALLKKPEAKRPVYSDGEYLECLREAAGELPQPMTHTEYALWTRGRALPDGRRWPGPQGVMIRFGSWRNALLQAGLMAAPSSRLPVQHDPDDFVQAVASAWIAQSKPPTVSEYDQWSRGNSEVPSSATIRKNFGSWTDLVAEAWWQVHAEFVAKSLGPQPGEVDDFPDDQKQRSATAANSSEGDYYPVSEEPTKQPDISLPEEVAKLGSAEQNVRWIFDPLPPSQAREGGIVAGQVLDSTIDTFVREVIQNSLDQALERPDKSKEKVLITFRLETLRGQARRNFLRTIGWGELLPHVMDSAEKGGSTIARPLTDGLEWLRKGELRLLFIEDVHTKGLSGPEDGEGNFADLCRNQLVTSAERTASGGSFGIGKSVLWRFSNLSTVLFTSRPEDSTDVRFIGRTYLPTHETEDGNWQGPGWLGEPAEIQGQARAESVWGTAAEEIATAINAPRSSDDTGTTAVILGFDDPSVEDEPSVLDTCQAILHATSKWYWPALHEDRLMVQVRGIEQGEEIFAESADPDIPVTFPYREAAYSTDLSDHGLEQPADVIEREISVTIPARQDGSAGKTETTAVLRLRREDPDGDPEPADRIALQRGTGMVVRYHSTKAARRLPYKISGVLLAGGAHGETDGDKALEEFLRASEPPAHDEWDHQTELLKSTYRTSGRRKAILGIYEQIDRILGELVPVIEEDTHEIPAFLRHLLPLGGSGKKDPTPKVRLGDTTATRSDDIWRFSGKFSNANAPSERAWAFTLKLEVDQEGSGKKTMVDVKELHAPGCSLFGAKPGEISVEVPAGCREVEFSGSTQPVAVPDPELVSLKLSATTIRNYETEGTNA